MAYAQRAWRLSPESARDVELILAVYKSGNDRRIAGGVRASGFTIRPRLFCAFTLYGTYFRALHIPCRAGASGGLEPLRGSLSLLT